MSNSRNNRNAAHSHQIVLGASIQVIHIPITSSITICLGSEDLSGIMKLLNKMLIADRDVTVIIENESGKWLKKK
mgnify:CR=1 FL=1